MKVYLSSTFRDLLAYREKAYRQLRRLRHDVISMEDGVAAHERPLRECLRDVELCDVYVGLFAWRYGFVPPDDNPDKLAITELEYRHALACGKTCLIFLIEESTPWPPQFLDSQTGEGGRGRSIRRLRKELAERHTVMFFANPDDLASSLSASMVSLQISEPPPTPELGRSTAAPRSGKEARPRHGHPNLWNPGDVLRVRFLDGSPRQCLFVERFAPIWTAYANLHFEVSDDPDAEVRVSFTGPGSWAYVGTTVLGVGRDAPTVNLGWITDASLDIEADHTILHEFGHVLGLQHEHQNPAAKIPWKKQAVRRTFTGPPNFWSEESIRAMLYTTWDSSLFPFDKPFDRESIMAFAFPAELTGPDHEMAQNVSLSQGDKEFVQRLYPY